MIVVSNNWWQDAVFYQIYPRSFQDSNGDGIGDLPGIISRVDYLDYLGVDVLWLSPVFASPNEDYGYDVSDYRRINAEYGTKEDLNELLEILHSRDMKLVLDMVVNHTSSEHRWFKESCSDPDGPRGDFYHWHPGSEGGEAPPNRWGAFFGGSAWRWNEERGEYYLHLFAPHQPDLNWENPRVREEVYDIMDHWLNRGVDGFRLDVINLISKPTQYPGGREIPGKDFTDCTPHVVGGPRLEEFLGEMRKKVFDNYDMVAVGEVVAVDHNQAPGLVCGSEAPLDMLLHFEHVSLDQGEDKWDVKPFSLAEFKTVLDKWYRSLYPEGWNAFYLTSHDQSRAVSRFGDEGKYRERSAKMLGAVLLTLPGTPFIYQGDEIGMTNVEFTAEDELKDIEAKNYFQNRIDAGEDPEKVLDILSKRSRDNSRTPMQWSSEEGAGFTESNPWIKIGASFPEVNVADQKGREGSALEFYRRMIDLRQKYPVLKRGFFLQSVADDEDLFVYWRRSSSTTLLILANFSAEEQEFMHDEFIHSLDFILSNVIKKDEHPEKSFPPLRPYEARIYEQTGG